MRDYKAQFFNRDGKTIGSLKLQPSTLHWISYGDKKKRSVSIEKFIK